MSSSVAVGLGYVLRPTLAGHRIRPTCAAPSTRCSLAQVEDTANGSCARTPNRQPRHPGGRQRRGTPPQDETGRRWCPRAQAPFAVSSTHPGRNPVDAAALCRQRHCPASVGRRTGAPPSPCRHDDGRPTRHRQSAKGRKRIPQILRSYVAERPCVRAAPRPGSDRAHLRDSSRATYRTVSSGSSSRTSASVVSACSLCRNVSVCKLEGGCGA